MRSVIPPRFIRLPAKINPGIQRSTKTSIPAYIFCGMITRGISAKITYANDESPRQKAMGNPRNKVNKKTPNNTAIIIYDLGNSQIYKHSGFISTAAS